MKKKLEAELISIAHKILKLKETSNIGELQEHARKVYEQLTILNFSETHFKGTQPTIGQIRSILDGKEEEMPKETEVKQNVDTSSLVIDNQQNTLKEETLLTFENPSKNSIEEKVDEKRPEHIIERINEKVSEDLFVPAQTITEENISLSEPVYEKNDAQDIGYQPKNMPILDREEDVKPKSLNDQLKKGIHIGLNDRLAFIKHLFSGSTEDYNRVLSQLNTLNSKSGAQQFIKNMVKPDYNNWEGKQEYEERFMEIVSNKFEY